MYIVRFTFLNEQELFWGPFKTYELAEKFMEKAKNQLASLYISDAHKQAEILQLHAGE